MAAALRATLNLARTPHNAKMIHTAATVLDTKWARVAPTRQTHQIAIENATPTESAFQLHGALNGIASALHTAKLPVPEGERRQLRDTRDEIQSAHLKSDPPIKVDLSSFYKQVTITPRVKAGDPLPEPQHYETFSALTQYQMVDIAIEQSKPGEPVVVGSAIATKGSVLNETMSELPAVIEHLIERSKTAPSLKERDFHVLVGFKKGGDTKYMDTFITLFKKAEAAGLHLTPCAFKSAHDVYARSNFSLKPEDYAGSDPVTYNHEAFLETQKYFLETVKPKQPFNFVDYVSTGNLSIKNAMPHILKMIKATEIYDASTEGRSEHVYSIGLTKGFFEGTEFTNLLDELEALNVPPTRIRIHTHQNTAPSTEESAYFEDLVPLIEGESEESRQATLIKLANICTFTELLIRLRQQENKVGKTGYIVDTGCAGEGGNVKTTPPTQKSTNRLSGGNLPSSFVTLAEKLLYDTAPSIEDLIVLIEQETLLSELIAPITGETDRQLTWTTELFMAHPTAVAEAINKGIRESLLD